MISELQPSAPTGVGRPSPPPAALRPGVCPRRSLGRRGHPFLRGATLGLGARLSLLAALLVLGGCEAAEKIVDSRRDLTPHEAYLESLREAGLGESALARAWAGAAASAVADPRSVSLPFAEEGYIAPEEPGAVGYRFRLERGQVLTWRIEVESDDSTRVFVDLFRMPADSTDPVRPVAEVDSLPSGVAYEPWRTGEYVLRLQPELLRGGRYRVVLSLEAALAFPVEGTGPGAVQSFFGADREGGRRQHHGVDIFAPRGTPVLAAAEGAVSRANETNLGGKVVWLRDARRNQSVYYAHLDSQAVTRGQRVRVGDTLGFVGNTGNARSTPPHLHFGIYRRGEGPVDPLPFIRPPRGRLPDPTADASSLGSWARARSAGVEVREGPGSGTDVLTELDPDGTVRLMGSAGGFFRVRLEDGRQGYVAAGMTEPAERPVPPEARSASASRPGPPSQGVRGSSRP